MEDGTLAADAQVRGPGQGNLTPGARTLTTRNDRVCRLRTRLGPHLATTTTPLPPSTAFRGRLGAAAGGAMVAERAPASSANSLPPPRQLVRTVEREAWRGGCPSRT